MKFDEKNSYETIKKKNIAVIFGGQSSEHEVSCMSVLNVAENIDKDDWNVILVGITEDGRWLLADGAESIRDGSWRMSRTGAVISPDAAKKCLIVTDESPSGISDGGRDDISDGTRDDIKGDVRRYSEIPLDLVFPVLHGRYGEDGTVQGLLEMAGIPYVGCGVLASAVCMDKYYTKIIAGGTGVRQAGYVLVRASELDDIEKKMDEAEDKLGYPVFVKPCRAGSSRGVSKAGSRGELKTAILNAAEHDDKILIEEFIKGREVECAVFEGKDRVPRASGVGEILAAADFYDYDAKYNNPDSLVVTSPDIDKKTAEEIRGDAIRIFKAAGAYGLSRVDFFIAEDGRVVFNEINTMPGFTAISMYPKLWEAAGISEKELIRMLIGSAEKR